MEILKRGRVKRSLMQLNMELKEKSFKNQIFSSVPMLTVTIFQWLLSLKHLSQVWVQQKWNLVEVFSPTQMCICAVRGWILCPRCSHTGVFTKNGLETFAKGQSSQRCRLFIRGGASVVTLFLLIPQYANGKRKKEKLPSSFNNFF